MNTKNANSRGSQTCFAWLLIPVMCFSLPALLYAREGRPKTLPRDQPCLACHGQAAMKSEAGKNISIDPRKHAESAHGILACQDCHLSISDFPHPEKIAKVQCSACHGEASSGILKNSHGVLGQAACSSCHGNVHEMGSASKLEPAKCAECHAQQVREFAAGVHSQAAKSGDPDAPKCSSCHGPVHAIRAAGDPASLVSKKSLPATCAVCHSNDEFLSRHKIPVAHPVEQYRQSVHGRAVLAGKNAATCSDCHGSHAIFAGRDSRSRINHWNVVETCAQCHKEIALQFNESVHGEALKAGVRDVPDCTNCHGEHLILEPKNPASALNAANVSAQTCGRCHADARLARLYDLPADRVPSYADSYHGLALRGGSLVAANCASCHGVHHILRSSNPRSTVNAANLRRTCGQCHQGIGDKLAIGLVHVQTASGPAHPVVHWIRWIYWILIPLTLGFMVFHNLLDLIAKSMRPKQLRDSGQRVIRMNLWFRIAHWGVMLSFPTLVMTGFALKYPDSWWSAPFLVWGKQDSFRGLLHRAAAVVLIVATLYHFIHLTVNRKDRAFLSAMMPKWKDVTDLFEVLLHNLGIRGTAPQFGKFNYAEKIEYWAFLWGTAVMGISGFLLWFNNLALRYFPKWTTDAATAVHWYEALLATFSILLWHFYQVIFDPLVYPMDTAWLHGKVPADHYRHFRPEYLRALEKAECPEPATASDDTSKRPKQDRSPP
jgi:cytochrome b subunit of formate dehydrogenase